MLFYLCDFPTRIGVYFVRIIPNNVATSTIKQASIKSTKTFTCEYNPTDLKINFENPLMYCSKHITHSVLILIK